MPGEEGKTVVARCRTCDSKLIQVGPSMMCPRCFLGEGLASEPGPHALELEAPEGPELPVSLESLEGGGASGLGGFGDYELLERIASGGMGVVYKARQKSLNRVVALKMLLGGQYATPQALARFRIEAEATAQLQHPNIVAIHEVGEHQGQPYLTMDYVEGRSLADLAREQPMPTQGAATYLKTIAEAIQYAHERGVLHRDVKPSNVLIDGFDEPRVTDFGLAKRLDTTEGELTVSGQTLGSPNFMPPEQAGGKKAAIGPASDVYGLGATLYYLVTGRPPFVGETISATARQVLEREPVPPRLLNPRLARDLETICLKCLEKDPGKRYGSARELGEELGRYLRGEPIQARPVGVLARGWRWCTRKPALAGAMGGAVLLFLLGSAGVTWQWLRADAQRRTAEHNLYVANMNRARQSWEENQIGRMRQLLRESQDYPEKGFEWYCLQRLAHPEAHTLRGQVDLAWTVAFVGDSRRLVCGGSEGTATVWNVETGEQTLTFSYPGRRYHDGLVAVSPDGSRVAASSGGGCWVWDPMTGRALVHPEDVMTPYAFSGDGRRLLAWHVVPSGIDEVGVYDASSGQRLLGLQGHATITDGGYFVVRSGAFSPDGRHIVTSDVYKTVRLWDANTGEPLRVLTNHTDAVLGVAFSPDSTKFVSASRDKTAIVWEAVTGQPLRTFREHNDFVAAVAYSPDGRWVVTAGADQAARIWDPESGLELRTLRGHSRIITSVAVSPDAQWIALASLDGTVTLWNVAGGVSWKPASGSERSSVASASKPKTQDGLEARAQPVLLSREVPEGWELCVYRAPVGLQASEGFTGMTRPDPLARLPLVFLDNRTCGTLDTNQGMVGLWDIEARAAWCLLPAEPRAARLWGTVRGDTAATLMPILALSSDRGRLLVGKNDGTVEVWDVPGRHPLFRLQSSPEIGAAEFTPDGRRIVTATAYFVVEVWDAVSGAREYFVRHSGALWNDYYAALAMAPDGEHFVSSSWQSGPGWLWKFGSPAPLFALRGHPRGLRAAFSPDGSRIVTASSDSLAKVWDAGSGRETCTLAGHAGYVPYAAFSPDGRRVVTCGFDRTVRVWDAQDGRELLTLKGHEGRFIQAIFSPDGQQIYSIDDACILRIWATATPSQIASWDKRDEAVEEEEKRQEKTRTATLDANLGPSVSTHLYVDQLTAVRERKDAQTTRKIWRDLAEVAHRRAQELRDPWVLPRITGEVFDQAYVLARLTGPITPESDCRVYPISAKPLAMLEEQLRAGKLTSAVLIATNAIWKYSYDDQALGRTWTQSEWKDDSAWPEGPAVLGFGESYIATRLHDASTPVPMTAYFRKVFRVEDPTAMPTLWLRLLVDDGAVVYLNGAEIFRHNILDGPIHHTSRASASIEATNYLDFVVEPGTLLKQTNILAVEVHQWDVTSSDLVFGLELLSGVPRFEELLHQPGAPSPSDYWRAALYLMKELSPKAGPAPFAQPVPMSYDHLVRWEASRLNRQAHRSIPWQAEWKYLDDGSDQGTAWEERALDDRLWKKGPAPLGYSSGGIPLGYYPSGHVATQISYGTNAPQKHVTTYFRKEFALDAPNPTQPLLLRLGTGSDGVVAFLNGSKILRDNLPTDTPTPQTLATAASNLGGQIYWNFIVEPGGRLGRTNVLAVEVHQDSTLPGGEMFFDLELLSGVPSPSELLTDADVQAARRVLVYEGIPLPEEILAAKPRR